ncbi:YdcF family protein [Ignavibacterium sp.]|uniref:YdcF family protein n=1 Tax=Ignavibacterium sp. TaxID=2651167 RepID=UPI00307FB9F3
MKSANNENKTVLYLLIASLGLQLLLLYFFKYQNQNLSIKNIDIEVTGNLFNLVTYLIAEILLIIVLLNPKIKTNLKLLSSLVVVSYLFLLIGFISTKIVLPFNSIYIFGQFGNKLFTGLCYTLYQLALFTFIFVMILGMNKNRKRIFSKSLFFAFILITIILIYSLFFIISREERVKLQPLNSRTTYTIVVLGAAVWSDNKPSPILAARVDKAIELLKNYNVGKLFLTGSNAPGELSEAEVALNYLKSKKILSEKIIIEKNTTSTTKQIQFLKSKLSEGEQKNLIVVSDSFHLVRIREISKFHKLKIITIASELELSFFSKFYNTLREALALTVFWFFAI